MVGAEFPSPPRPDVAIARELFCLICLSRHLAAHERSSFAVVTSEFICQCWQSGSHLYECLDSKFEQCLQLNTELKDNALVWVF